ncbi:MAG: rRNA pseudouridine synthase, partial [Burkholderiales bacterium]|nr:rRNA pseudouridine synthase [Burkholderiales bacterium]
MNPQDSDSPPPDTPAVNEAVAAPKPRRRRVAAAAEATDAVAPAAEGAADVPAEVTKPKRARRKAAPVAEAVAEGPEAAVEPVAAEAVVVPSAALGMPAEGEVAGGPAEGAEAASGESTSAEGTAEREGGRSRRNRNRRRNRRGGERGARDEAAPGAPTDFITSADAQDDEDDDEEREAAPPLPTLPVGDINETFADVVSGAYDALPPEEPDSAAPERRVLAPEPDAPKLHKLLAQAGIGSRRDMETLIQDGRVTVNNQPAHIGQRVSWGDQIKVGGKPIKVRIAPPPPRVLAYHKPVGEVVTNDDPQHRPTVFRKLPRLHQGKWQSVGRLDINTEGLLLFTNSGDLANQLMHPRFGIEREYAVRVLGTLDEDNREELLEGVDVDGQMCCFQSIADGGGEGANHWYRVVIAEGRNREVRKL